jgi:thiamine-phosphate pyrophosphorylase
MTPNATRCSAWRLYVIVDRTVCGSRDLADVTASAIRGGADVIQLRDKRASDVQLIAAARRLLLLTRSAGIPLIVNDRPEVCLASGADGLHLGQDDLPVEEARRLLGPERLIGRSTHGVEQAQEAQAQLVDYIGFGPVFPTPTKPDYGSIGTARITQVLPHVRTPMVCIGGIDEGNVRTVLEAGATCVAVVRAVCAASDPEAAARALKQIITQTIITQTSRSSTSVPL